MFFPYKYTEPFFSSGYEHYSHLNQYISTVKYVRVSVLAKKMPPFGAIKYSELKADT